MATKWGICSAGKISNDFLVALETLPAQDHQVVAVAARDLKQARDFAQIRKIPKAYGSYEALANDPDIDVIYVGVLHTVHRDVVLMFLEHKKNVLCEKPLAMNSDEVRELTSAARKIPSCMWCPTSIIVNGKETKFPLPHSTKPMHFTNSTGLSYEAEHVRQCLLKGLKESPIMSLKDSELLSNIMDEVRGQLGVKFHQDKKLNI
ncbi:hypothetical protein XELAEV_18037834mg [Xenopus laevis]|uniref:Trans-1,2-dihydrobenzene-1,2-diol dehydrogenase n=1 Tax=Xenopus laevis TaxID=8355 RepID=A0A974HAJ0_XENLA|nr:hypothetical protein XELAEV_18037834mg [Xenopus laevis]